MRRVMLSSQRSSTVAFVSINKGYLLRLGRVGIAQTGTRTRARSLHLTGLTDGIGKEHYRMETSSIVMVHKLAYC
jgi:hypothetical protein